METLIRVSLDELKVDLLDKIKLLIQDDETIEIIIHLKQKVSTNLLEEDAGEYIAQLNKSIAQRSEGKTVLFNMEELDKYVKENFTL